MTFKGKIHQLDRNKFIRYQIKIRKWDGFLSYRIQVKHRYFFMWFAGSYCLVYPKDNETDNEYVSRAVRIAEDGVKRELQIVADRRERTRLLETTNSVLDRLKKNE